MNILLKFTMLLFATKSGVTDFLLLSEAGVVAGGFSGGLPIWQKPDRQNKGERNFYEQPNRFHGFARF